MRSHFLKKTLTSATGNAKIAGIEKDLGMAGFDYNIALTVFYIFASCLWLPGRYQF